MDAIQCLKTRRSIRVYQDKPVPEELITDIVDCGRLAATAMNHQPWTFVIVRDPAVRKRVAEIMGHSAFVAQAPLFIAVFCRKVEFFVEDGSAATQNILLAGWAHGLGTCWIAGEKMAYAAEIAAMLGAPADQALLSMVSVGYPAETPTPDKRSLPDVLRWDRF